MIDMTDTDSRRYLLISPCRDEEKYMRRTIESVIHQSVLPTKWVIVNDGSSDSTPYILDEYEKKYPFINVIHLEDRGERKVGPGVIEAFYKGYNTINIDDFDYLCKLDLDLILPRTYFEQLILKMESNPRLGTYSGKAYFVDELGNLISEKCGDESSLGMTKFYRVDCFKQIGGFVRQVMWDGIDSHRCRRLGWISSSEDREEIRFTHLRPMGSSQNNIITGRMRHGFGQYYMGTGLLFMIASTVYRLSHPPILIGALASLWGYLKSAIIGVERLNDPETVKLMRKFQMRSLLVGKNNAVEYINKIQRPKWDPNGKSYEMPNLE